MTSQAPTWRVKTRPCPFYQRGRCLFADSCNFLHTVSVRPSPGVTIIDSPRKLEQAIAHPLQAPPIIAVESPPRSPRLSGLLHALRDVIGDDPEVENSDLTTEDTSNVDLREAWNDNTVTEEGGYATFDPEEMGDTYPSIAFSDDSAPRSRVTTPLPHGADDDTGQDGVEENRPRIRSLSHTRNYSSVLPEPPPEYAPKRASRRRSTSMSGLYDRSSLHRPSHLQLDSSVPPEIDSEEKDSEVFIDSGYAESWQPPSPLAFTSPRAPIHSSTSDLLTSPFCSPSTKMCSHAGILGRLNLQSAVEDDAVSENNLDCTADCPSPRHEVEKDALGTIQHSVMTDCNVIENDVNQLNATISAGMFLGTRPGDGVEAPTAAAFEESGVLGPVCVDANSDTAETSKSIVASAAELLPLPSSDEQSGTGTTHTENAPAIWKKGFTPHQGVSPGRTEASRSFVHRVDENTYGLDATNVAVLDFDSEEPVSNDRTPNLTEDVGDDNTSIRSSRSSPRLAYMASPTSSISECNMHPSSRDAFSQVPPPGDAAYSSILLQLESSFRPPFSATSSFNDSSQEQAITAFTDTQNLTPSSNSSMLSPVESQAFLSSQNSGASTSVQPPFEDSAKLKTSSGAFWSRKVPFGWRSSGKPQSRSSNIPPSRRASFQRSNEIRSGHNSSYERRPDSASMTYDTSGSIRPLRLSSSAFPQHISFKPFHSSNGSITSHSPSTNRISMSSSVSSARSPFYNHLLSPARTSSIPERIRNSLFTSQESIPSPLSEYSLHLRNFGEPRSAPISPNSSWYPDSSNPYYEQITFDRAPSRASEPSLYRIDEQEDGYTEKMTTRELTQIIPHSAPPISRRSSRMVPAVHAIATPRPTLFFAIASDKVDEVRKVLESGHAGPNEAIGPQSALEFALTNDQLTHKMEIVKLLLAYGANPRVARNHSEKQRPTSVDPRTKTELAEPNSSSSPVVRTTILEEVDAATRYYVEKAEAPDTRRASALMHRSSFRPLTRVRYEIVGQDRALEQLFKLLSIHTRHLSATPIVVLLCGPSGHGKSLLARKFGSLLDVPTHTVNMTTLKSTHDLWKSYSMSPYETPTTCTLAEFLVNNEGKRCVVVLDEIEKTEDEKALWSLLMPWELGRCSIEAGSRHVDVRNVVWLGTSNIGHDMILKYQEARECPQEPFSQEEYTELMGLLRPKVSECLGASVLSRVTRVLPFVPFTLEERKVICSEALYSLAGEAVRELTPQAVEKMVDNALVNYCSEEGARSLYRAVSNHLVDII